MSVIPLTYTDLGSAAIIVLCLAVVSNRLRLGLGRRMVLAGVRMTLQLLLVGLILRQLFQHYSVFIVCTLALIMIGIAGREIMARQKIKTRGLHGYGVGVLSMFLSSFTLAVFSLIVIIQVYTKDPPE